MYQKIQLKRYQYINVSKDTTKEIPMYQYIKRCSYFWLYKGCFIQSMITAVKGIFIWVDVIGSVVSSLNPFNCSTAVDNH